MRIALILPRHRRGTWHERLVESLSGAHDVKVLIDDGMPPYPFRIRTWLGIERLLYRQQRGASSDFAGEALSPYRLLITTLHFLTRRFLARRKSGLRGTPENRHGNIQRSARTMLEGNGH